MPETFVINNLDILLPSRAAAEVWKEVGRLWRIQGITGKMIQVTLEMRENEIWLESVGVKPAEPETEDEVPF